LEKWISSNAGGKGEKKDFPPFTSKRRGKSERETAGDLESVASWRREHSSLSRNTKGEYQGVSQGLFRI